MTLEDFFTLTEMKDGLTAPSRVHELVVVMQKERDCIVKNVGDATRQWAAVASTIAATENKDCLDLFIQLDGLAFVDKWLKDAEMYDNDAADGFVEESLIALLRALEKLQIDKERSVSSGIWITVNHLLDHGSSRIQDRARALFNDWKLGRASNDVATERSKGAESAVVDVFITEKTAKLENSVAEPARDKNVESRGSSFLQSEKVKEQPDTNVEHLSPEDMPVLSNSIQESPQLKERVSLSAVEGTTLTETHSLSISRGPSTELDLDTSKKLNDSNMIASPSSNVEAGLSSPTDANTNSAAEDMTEPAMECNDAKERDFEASVSLPKSGNDDGEGNNCIVAQDLNSTTKKDCSPDAQPDSFLSNKKSEKPEDIETPFSHMLDIRADDDDDDGEQSSDIPEYLRDGCDFTKTADTQSTDRNNRRKSDIELDYGMVDALEVALQVAQEVEREVVDYREQPCSSSPDKIMASRDSRQLDSPDSINTKQEQNQAAEAFPVGRNCSNSRETEAENGIHELESSQVTEVAPEQEMKTEQSLCDFDLNQEVCSDDIEHTTANPISTSVSVVSASRPAVASGSPSAPLQFEGILGWKGSAATSAFRPASPRKISDSNSSKQRKGNLDFDLNVAEEGDQKMLDLMPGRPTPVSSGLQSGESSLEVGPRRSERPNLDLNRISNEADFPQSTLRMEGQLFHPRNGHRSPSPASSSSSLRNFDLNDRPIFHSDPSNVSPFGISGPGDPVISLLGTRVEVGGRAEICIKEINQQQHLSLGHGNPMGGVMGIPTVPYSHSPGFGYNGVTAAPHMSRSSAMYGAGTSIPYVMDTRVASMVPQIPPYSQPSFLMNMASARPNFDLNSGFTNDSGNAAGGLRQFLMPGQSRSLEDHLRANVQPTPSSGLGVKRREPDGGWESYYLPYKYPQPPWR